MKTKTNPAAIGIFIAGAIVILFASLVIFGGGRFFHKTKDLLLTFREPVTGLDVGAPVKLMGVTIGSVKEVQIGLGNMTNDVFLINVVVEIDVKTAQSSFGDYKVDLEDPKRFERLTQELGLRGRLDMLSMLSGQLYIALDMYPGEEGYQLHEQSKHALWEIPTRPSTKRQLMQSLVTSLEKFTQFDVQGISGELRGVLTDLRGDLTAMRFGEIGTNLVGSLQELREILGDPQLRSAITNLNQTLAEFNQLGGSLNKQVNPLLAEVQSDLRKTGNAFDEATKMFSQLQTQVNPDSTLSRELVRTLDDASRALNALRQLAEEVQRNPSSLVTGKKEPKP